MKEYYLMLNGQKHGPFSEEKLKEQDLSDQVLLWSEDMPDWAIAKTIPELKGFFKVTPPDTPYEKLELTESSAFTSAMYNAFYFGALTFFVVIIFLAGILDDTTLHKFYSVQTQYDETPSRWIIIVPIVLFISFSLSSIWLFIDYRIRINAIFKRLLNSL